MRGSPPSSRRARATAGERGILRRRRTYGTTGPTMSRARTKLLVLLVAALLIILALRAIRGRSSSTSVEAADESLIDGRAWVEGRPDKLTDYVHAAFFITRANFGIFERGSAYELRLEFFDLTRQKGALKIHFPQTKK